jgi:hypothetical protein
MVQTRASNKEKRVGLPDLSVRLHDKATTGNEDSRKPGPSMSIDERQDAIEEIARVEHELFTHKVETAAKSRDPPGPSITKQPRSATTMAKASSEVNTKAGMW